MYKWTTKTWADVLVGDVILLKENDPIPADTIILSSSNSDGSCYVETMNLDGETNLKTRAAVDITQELICPLQLASEPLSLQVELPNPSLHSFTGTLHRPTLTASSASLGFSNLLLRGCHLRNTDWVIGMVIYTGAETKIRLNAGKTPSKRSYNEKMMNIQV
jgi:phospholipid-translocating ATPase